MKSIPAHIATLAAACLGVGSALATPLQDIPFKTATGEETSLKAYSGKVLLVVNVASKCGHTKQYTPLQKLQDEYGPKGFTVLAFPCNDFKGQEPGTNEQIKEFCEVTYGIKFPIFDKLHVLEPDRSALYTALSGPDAKFPGPVKWNFGKFLIGKDGEVLARFDPKTQPDDPTVIAAIDSALK